MGEPLKMVPPGRSRAKPRLRLTPSCGRGRRCLPEGKRPPPPATPSFRVENTNTANQNPISLYAYIRKIKRIKIFPAIHFYAFRLLLSSCSFRRGLVGPRRRVPIMKHSHLVRVTRLSHPKDIWICFWIPARLCREPGGGAPGGTLQGSTRNARKLTLTLPLDLLQ